MVMGSSLGKPKLNFIFANCWRLRIGEGRISIANVQAKESRFVLYHVLPGDAMQWQCYYVAVKKLGARGLET